MQIEQTGTSILQEEPLVSFIIIAYNLPIDMLKECVESILTLGLDHREYEIILVDDGSDVPVIAQLTDFQDVLFYLRQQNQGISVARNNGLRVAKGKYIQFIDGDDKLLNDPYCQCMDLLRAENPDMLLFNFTDKDHPSGKAFKYESPSTGASYMHTHNLHASACCYLFLKNLLAGQTFTPGIYHEDEEFTPLLMLKAEKVIATDSAPYYYRKREESIVNKVDDNEHVAKRLDDTEQIIYKLKHKADTLPEMERVAMNRRVAQLTMDYIYRIITQTKSRNYLTHKIEELRKEGLYPLPEKDYTAKYSWFRRLSNSQTGQNILLRLLPLLKEER